MPTHFANLDALIRREDFEVKSDKELTPAQLASTMQISQLEPESFDVPSATKTGFSERDSKLGA